MRDPETSGVRVIPNKRRFDVNAAANLSFTVLDTDYRAVPFAHLRRFISLILRFISLRTLTNT